MTETNLTTKFKKVSTATLTMQLRPRGTYVRAQMELGSHITLPKRKQAQTQSGQINTGLDLSKARFPLNGQGQQAEY